MDNLDLAKQHKEVLIRVNPRLYPLEAVYSAAYVFMDRAYITLDGDAEHEIIVTMRLKPGVPIQDIEGEFSNELLNYADYLSRSKQTKEIRETLLKRAITTNDPQVVQPEDVASEDFESIDDDFLDDPEGISIPWEEKYGEDKKEGVCQDDDKTEQ